MCDLPRRLLGAVQLTDHLLTQRFIKEEEMMRLSAYWALRALLFAFSMNGCCPPPVYLAAMKKKTNKLVSKLFFSLLDFVSVCNAFFFFKAGIRGCRQDDFFFEKMVRDYFQRHLRF